MIGETFYQWAVNYGYPGVFIANLVADSLIPTFADGVMVLAVFAGLNKFLIVILSTLGCIIGGYINYGIGKFADIQIVHRFYSEKKLAGAEQLFDKYGSLALLLSWLPFVGDPITAVAGVLDYNLKKFSIYMPIAKFVKCAFVVYLGAAILSIL